MKISNYHSCRSRKDTELHFGADCLGQCKKSGTQMASVTTVQVLLEDCGLRKI